MDGMDEVGSGSQVLRPLSPDSLQVEFYNICHIDTVTSDQGATHIPSTLVSSLLSGQ